MPELPEVEVVRRGLADWLIGARLGPVEVLDARAVRRHLPGPADFAAQVTGSVVSDVVRRGKYCWLALDDDRAVLAHLGMSGQLLLHGDDAPDERHLRVRIGLALAPDRSAAAPEVRQLRFVDQRLFGGLTVTDLVATPDGLPAGLGGPGSGVPSAAVLPPPVAHIARDLLDPALTDRALLDRLRRRRTGIKRALLDQTLMSGVGNIYADEALWRARLHFDRRTDRLGPAALTRVLDAAREVMRAALAEGGTSFDSLYVNVNGESGYFSRGLAVYGRAGQPCPRCGTTIRREAFMNRSSFRCPRCQRPARDGG